MPQLVVLSGVFIALGTAIAWKQSRAKSCPLHNRTAGRLAVAAAIAAFSLGILTLVLALVQ